MLYVELRPQTAWDILTLSLAGRQPKGFLETAFGDTMPQISPSGRSSRTARWKRGSRRSSFIRPRRSSDDAVEPDPIQ